MKKNLESIMSSDSLIDVIGKRAFNKLKETYPDMFESEAEKKLQPFKLECDDHSAMITIANKLSHAERSAEKCYLLHPDYVWAVIKRYDASGAYQSYLVPTHRSIHKIRRKRKGVKVAE